MGASTYQYDSECRKCGKLEYFCKCEPYPKLTEKQCACLNDEADHKWSEWREIALVGSASHFRRYCRGCGKDERKQQTKEAQGE